MDIFSQAVVLAIANQKGGVGKTTTALNLAVGLKRLGKRVLAIDSDPHGNLTQGFGFPIQDLKTSLRDLIEDRTGSARHFVLSTSSGVDLIPANPLLAKTARWMTTQTNGELRLKQRIGELRTLYDYILIDSCPGLGTLLNSTLNASDRLLIPIDASFFGYMGVKELLNEVDEIKLGTNPALKVLGFLLTLTDRTLICQEILDVLLAKYQHLVFKTQIRRCVSLKESPGLGQDIFRYSPKSVGANDYSELTVEIESRIRDIQSPSASAVVSLG